MRVLVTRPEPYGLRTAEKIALSGHDAVRMPLFETRVTAAVDDFPAAKQIGGLIATSGRAFAMFKCIGLPAAGVLDVPVYVVGPATAAAAREAGFTDIREGGGTAQELAGVVAIHQSAACDAAGAAGTEGTLPVLVYLAGTPRTPTIEDSLLAARLPFMVLECYQMAEISYSTDIIASDILSPPPDLVLLYSANAARRFHSLVDTKSLGNALDLTRFVCLSPAIATELPEAWQTRVITADHPNEDSLLASLAALG